MGSLPPPSEERITPESAHRLVRDILVAYGTPSDRAALVADSLVLADLRGVDSHGINRLPSYIARVRSGLLEVNPELTFDIKTPVIATLDAKNTFGFVAASMAIDKGIEIAGTYGLAMVGVKHSNHYGMASTYLLRANRSGFGAMAFTNASRAMPAWGGAEKLFGTSPFAVGLPGGENGDFVLDMSPSVAARGKIRKAARRGESIPEGFALDEQGRPTTDPNAALKGSVLPIGGPKGSGIASMMDIFAGLMTGAAFKGDVGDMNGPGGVVQNVGHPFLVFRPDVFLGEKQEYLARMNELLDTIRKGEKADGFKRVYSSGEIEAEKSESNRRCGISYTTAEIETLHRLAESVQCDARLEPVA